MQPARVKCKIKQSTVEKRKIQERGITQLISIHISLAYIYKSLTLDPQQGTNDARVAIFTSGVVI